MTSAIVTAAKDLEKSAGSRPAAMGVGVAGQIDEQRGVVRFAPNLVWREVPLGAGLSSALDLPVAVTNDVRAATWGEWLHGAGRGTDDLICVFVGTGIGGGVVSSGQDGDGLLEHGGRDRAHDRSTCAVRAATAGIRAASRRWPAAGPSREARRRPSSATPERERPCWTGPTAS